MNLQDRKKIKAKLISYLENECSFRDYRILPSKLWRKISKQGVHHHFSMSAKLDRAEIEYEVNDCLHTFNRNGYSTIYFYL